MGSDEHSLPPDEAFWLLGDKTRVAILQAVWDTPTDLATFSEIRNSVGNPDSGQFNYHLNKLKGHYLIQEEDGYRLTQAGRELIRAVLAGTITTQPETTPTRINAICTECGGELVGLYDEYGIIECADCETTVMWNEFPPAGLEGRTPEEFASTFDRWTVSRFRLAMDGVCPNCAAEMSCTLLNSETEEDTASHHRCENCGYEARVPVFGHVIFHPAVISFYYEQGIDVTEMPYWRLKELAQEFSVHIVSEQPWNAEIVIWYDDQSLGLCLNEEFEVVETVS